MTKYLFVWEDEHNKIKIQIKSKEKMMGLREKIYILNEKTQTYSQPKWCGFKNPTQVRVWIRLNPNCPADAVCIVIHVVYTIIKYEPSFVDGVPYRSRCYGNIYTIKNPTNLSTGEV